jgi:acetylornithine deacetylase/succinyl-diaminopimelate desuccinylase family protein
MSKSVSPVVRLLRELVSIPSVNPTGTPGTEHVGEEALARFVGGYLEKAGATISYQWVEKGRPNLLARFGAKRAKARRVVFAPHLDTVSVLGMTVKPFDPVIKSGRLYGRGASDTKGPMAAMLVALADWAQSEERESCDHEIVFAGLMGEEAGNDGAHALANSDFRADFIVVGEPTQMRIVHAHKSALWLNLKTTGRACHASTPEKGLNAISVMRRVLALFEDEIGPTLAKEIHPLLGPVTMNIGTIQGGSKVNIVPDRCVMEVDFRTVPCCDNVQTLRKVKQMLRASKIPVEISTSDNPPPLETDPENSWVRQLRTVCPKLDVAPWFCDAAIFAKKGIPSIALGPGSIAQAHTKDEYITVSDLESGAVLFRRYLSELSKPDDRISRWAKRGGKSKVTNV